jgi:hypothetical protein
MNKTIPCEIYDRVCGYYRPVNQANHGKRQEIADRKRYSNKQIEEVLNESENKPCID